MKKKVFIIFFCCFAFVSSCKIDINYDNELNNVSYTDSANWMSFIDNSTVFGMITIPGTHDSCANYDFLGLSSVSATQDLSIEEQLDAGVRCFDIRINDDNGIYKIHHGPQFMHYTLEDVVSICRNFLQKHPSEIIVLLFMGEYKTRTRDVTPIVDNLVASEPLLFWQQSNADGATIGELRGKIIASLRYYDSQRTKCLDESTCTEEGCKSSTVNTAESWKQIESLLVKNASSNFNKPHSIFTATYFKGQFGIPNIRISSSFINSKLLDYLSEYENTDSHFGMIVTDHISRKLARVIYRCNLLN